MLKDILRKDKSNLSKVRFFIGYSGWDAGQLEMELDENSWVVKENVEDNILDILPKNLWKDTLRKNLRRWLWVLLTTTIFKNNDDL